MKIIIAAALCFGLLVGEQAQSQTNRVSGSFTLPGGVVNNQAQIQFKVFKEMGQLFAKQGLQPMWF